MTCVTPAAVPRLLASAGLGGATASYAGDTAMAGETIDLIGHDLLVVGLAATLVNLVLLALFLRSLVAPLLIVATSLLGIAATLGLTAYFTRLVLGEPDVTYYVPLAVGVLLLSLGTDYNLFVVGRIWQESDGHEIGSAIRAAVPRAGRAISIAALALAASFGRAGDRSHRAVLVVRLRRVRGHADRRVRRADADDPVAARRVRRGEPVARPPRGRACVHVGGAELTSRP